jgi:hypothetical protein
VLEYRQSGYSGDRDVRRKGAVMIADLRKISTCAGYGMIIMDDHPEESF